MSDIEQIVEDLKRTQWEMADTITNLRAELAAALEDRAFYSSAFAAKDDELTTAKELLQQAYECRDKLWPVGVSVRIHNFLENKNGL